MGTIASLLGQIGESQPRPWDIAQRSTNEAQTGLLTLADLKAKQQAEALMFERIKNDPALAQELFGTIASLPTSASPAGMPVPAPMTQQTVMPGQAPGAPQTVPGGQDLSRFAGVSPQGGGPLPAGVGMPTVTPPQSAIASLGPAGQPQMQAPRNPLLEMAQRDPRAAMMLQDQQIKAFRTQLTIREKTAEAFATKLQGVNSQESYEVAVQDLLQWAPQQASRLPKVWSKEAMQPIIDSALSAKDKASLDIASLTEQTAFRTQLFKERQAAAGVPKYTEDSTLNVAIDRRMQQAGIPRGTPPSEAILTQAQEDVETAKVRVSASQGTGQIVKGPTGEYIRVRPGTDQVEVIQAPGGGPLREKPSEAEQKSATLANSVAAANKRATELEDKGYEPKAWEKGADMLPLGIGNLVTSSEHQQYRQTVSEFASAWLYGVSGAQINDDEWERANQTFFRQPNEDKAAVALKRQRRADLVKQLEQQTAATGRTGTQAPPTSQGSTGTATGPATFDRADFLNWRKGAGKSGNPTQADVEAYFQAKGLKRK